MRDEFFGRARRLTAGILAALFPAWPLPVCATVFSKPKRAQRKSRAVLTILLVAPLALVTTSGANAQPILESNTNFSGTLTSPPFTEIHGNNKITAIGNAVNVGPGGNLTIDTTAGKPGPIVINGGTLPNQEPFEKAEIVYRDTTVTALKFAYLDEGGGWKDTWDGAEAKATPKAVKITVATTLNGRAEELPPITVSLRVAPPQ